MLVVFYTKSMVIDVSSWEIPIILCGMVSRYTLYKVYCRSEETAMVAPRTG